MKNIVSNNELNLKNKKNDIQNKRKNIRNVDLLKRNLFRICILAFIGGIFILLSSIDMIYRFTDPKRLSKFISDGFMGTNKNKFYFNIIHFYGILFGYIGAIIILFYAILILTYIFINKAYKRFLWGITIANAFIAILLAIAIIVLLTQILYEIKTTKFSMGESDYTFKPASWVAKAIGVVSISAIGGKMNYLIWVVVIAMVYSGLGILLFILCSFSLLTGNKIISPEVIKNSNNKRLKRKLSNKEKRSIKRTANQERRAEAFIKRENIKREKGITLLTTEKTKKFKNGKKTIENNNKQN
ncbi:hypothetical protein [Spiroplasma endosymbiont of Aspidapion aeneum]|uniref:hypothetical protein n=1 Tax=Spiroplasma endosymbiont of Aspidapion aeneum TaxID=3066276 RepID=UPI00313E199E